MIIFVNEHTHTHTHTHTFNGPFSGTTRVSQYQKGKNQSGFYRSKNQLQWYQLGHMQICTSLQTDNHASTPPLSFLQAGYALPAAQPKASKHLQHSARKRGGLIHYVYRLYILAS